MKALEHRAMARPDAASGLSRPRRWIALAVLAAALLVVSLDMTILNVALPHISAELRPTAAQQLWIVDVYSLVLAGLLVPASAIADRFGRKRVLLIGFAIFGGVSAFIVVADTASQVIAIRAALGLAGAMIMPTTLSLIRVIFTEPNERATALGVWAAVSAAGMAVGPLVGGALLEHFSWHYAFLINLPLMAIALVAGVLLLPEYRMPVPPRWDMVATLLSIAGMTALVWSIKRFAAEGFTDELAWLAIVSAVVLLVGFVVRCLKSREPMLDLRLFRSRSFTAGILAALGAMFALGALMLLLAQWLQLVDGRSPLGAGVAMLPAAAAMLLTSPVAPWLARKTSPRAVLAGGLAVVGVGFAVLALAPSPLTYPWVALSMVLLGGGGSSLAVGSAIIMSGTPESKAGNAAALEEASYEVGSLLGVAVLGSVASAAYAGQLGLDRLLNLGLDGATASAARESIAAAAEIAQKVGSPELMTLASRAFVDSLTLTGAVGAVSMALTAAVIFALIPRGFSISGASH